MNLRAFISWSVILRLYIDVLRCVLCDCGAPFLVSVPLVTFILKQGHRSPFCAAFTDLEWHSFSDSLAASTLALLCLKAFQSDVLCYVICNYVCQGSFHASSPIPTCLCCLSDEFSSPTP